LYHKRRLRGFIMYRRGLRVSEACGLRLAQIDLDGVGSRPMAAGA